MQKASPSWQEAKDWQWQEACRRETVIRPLAEQEAVSRQAAAAAAEQLGIGRALVYRLVARFRARPQTSSLAPGVRGRGFCSCALDSGGGSAGGLDDQRGYPTDLLKVLLGAFARAAGRFQFVEDAGKVFA
jgi:Helix-turn-helix domain